MIFHLYALSMMISMCCDGELQSWMFVFIDKLEKCLYILSLPILMALNMLLSLDVDFYFVMQIRRSLLNEDEYGFRKAKRPIYYDEGLEVIRLHFDLELDSTFFWVIGICWASYVYVMIFWKAEDQADLEWEDRPTKFCHW